MKSYDYKISIDTFDVGPGNVLTLSSILKYQEEAGEKHLTNAFSLDYNTIRSRGVVFVITNCAVKITRLPKLKENVTINTWNKGVKGFKFVRNYDWRDDNGNIIIEGSSVCVLVSEKLHSIERPSALGFTMPEDKERENSVSMPKKILLKDELLPVGSKQICYSLLDGNDHLNNSHYADFLVDFTPLDMVSKICGFEIDFVREAKYSDEVMVKSAVKKDYAEFSGEINNEICFRGKVYFQPLP